MGERIAKGGAFPRLVESTLRYWVEGAFFFVRPLVWWGHIDGFLFYGSYSLLCSYVLLLPGPYSGEPLFPAIEGLASGGGNAASPG